MMESEQNKTDKEASEPQDENRAEDSAAQNDGESKASNVAQELLYLRAEFENTKKRMQREQEQSIRFANERLVRELVGVVDLLERGVTHAKTVKESPNPKTEADFANLLNGVDLTLRELVQLMGRFGVEFVGNPGEKFDPNRHEAISQKESTDAEDETIAAVMQKGCLLHGRLLTPAKVVVNRKKAD